MRAVQVTRFGGPEVLVPAELPDPVPASGEVLIEVTHADTIFLETQLRSGWGLEYFPVEPPYVPGGGVAGTVTALGPEVPRSWLGRRVTALVNGGYASLATAPVTTVTPVPDDLDLLSAAALVHDGVTAAGLMELTAISADDRVLILGASGGMGTLLVQLARAAGASVVALARGVAKLDLVRRLGADTAIDPTNPDWPALARRALGPDGATVVLDGVGGELGAKALPLAADNARFSAHGAPTGGFAALDPRDADARGIKLFGIGDVRFSPADLLRLTAHAFAEAAAVRLEPVIGEVFLLEAAGEAHAAIEGRGLVGKVVLKT
ncbi:zinc-binding dehydrogenase [Streptomyces cavernae]|uniref:zinc-binding dehydrogenase n=1 Tax=Streptomyces cavernae TaxID=2259034 RepID=UPI000FEC1707|nr:zinc-binding dehydrogenase [Streptomyces cavernae]